MTWATDFVSRDSFVAGLDKKDLVRLRYLTRKSLGFDLTDAHCDVIIDELGPEAAVDSMKRAVDGSLID